MSEHDLSFTKLLLEHRQSLEVEREPRKSLPSIAVLTFKIDIRSLDSNGNMGESVLSKTELLKYGMSNKAQIFVKGQTEADCIKKVKNILENIDAKSRE